MGKKVIYLKDDMATVSLGSAFATACQQTCIIYLYGDVGVGKTTFCRGFLHGLGYIGNVKSPTYVLVEPYQVTYWTVYHFDLYRIVYTEELEFMGVRDYFDHKALYLVEWPQKGKGVIPKADITISINYYYDSRQAHIQSLTTIGAAMLAYLLPQQEYYS